VICQCAWCNTVTGLKDPLTDISITHGICDGCKEKVLSKIKKPAQSENSRALRTT